MGELKNKSLKKNAKQHQNPALLNEIQIEFKTHLNQFECNFILVKLFERLKTN